MAVCESSTEKKTNFGACQITNAMKTIYILRHAKSSWDTPNLIDHQRPIIEKGIKRTMLIGDYLAKNNIKTGLMISSDAVRAFETSKLIAAAIGYPIESIKTDHRIYLEGGRHIFEVINDVPQKIDSIMIVGHNPTLTNFVNDFTDDSIEWLPTSGIVSISFETDDWKEITGATSTLNFAVYPKQLKEKTD